MDADQLLPRRRRNRDAGRLRQDGAPGQRAHPAAGGCRGRRPTADATQDASERQRGVAAPVTPAGHRVARPMRRAAPMPTLLFSSRSFVMKYAFKQGTAGTGTIGMGIRALVVAAGMWMAGAQG